MSFHIASLSPRGSSQSSRTVAGLQWSSRNCRAAFFRSCWSELNAKSIGLSLHPVGADLLGQPEHALADDVLLDLRRARVDRACPGPQERGGERARLARRRGDLLHDVVGSGHELAPGPQDLERDLEIPLLELRV